MTKAEKQIETQVDEAFKIHATGVEIPMMNLGAVLNAGRDAAKTGESIDEAIRVAVKKYRKNDHLTFQGK